MSEKGFRVTFIKLLFSLEKSTGKNIESLRAELREDLTKLKNAMKAMQFKMDTLNAG